MSSPLRARPVLEPTEAPPYRLSLLGAWDLRGPDGRQIQSVLAQPKRLCLLAYLALQAEPVTRSTLVALFWPDKDEERARNALSQALFYLRRSMGNSVVENVAGDRIRVSAETVWFDAREVLAAYDRGERANEGHGADDLGAVDPDFFRGWNSDDNQPVQEWLDGIRRRFGAIDEQRRAARDASPDPESPTADPNGDDAEAARPSSPTDPRAAPRDEPAPSAYPSRLLTMVGVALLTALVVLTSIGLGWLLHDAFDGRAAEQAPEMVTPPEGRIAILQPVVLPEGGLPDAMAQALDANLVHRFAQASPHPESVISIPFGHTRFSTESILEATTETTTPLRIVEVVVQVERDGIRLNATLYRGAGSLVVERAVQCTYPPVDAIGPAILPGQMADDVVGAFGSGPDDGAQSAPETFGSCR